MRIILFIIIAVVSIFAQSPSENIFPAIAVHDTSGNITMPDSIFAMLYADTLLVDIDSNPMFKDSCYFARLQLRDEADFYSIVWGVEKYGILQIVTSYFWNRPDSVPVPVSQESLMLTSSGDTSSFIAWNDTIWGMFDSLATAHGDGDWRSSISLPIILTMDETEFVAAIDGASSRPIRVYRGDSKVIDITVTTLDRDSVDVSGATAIFTARIGESDTVAVIIDTLSIENGPAGQMRLVLSPEQTTITPRSYAADIQLTMPDSTVHTIWRSRFEIEWDVTR
ncbi:MAG: hypothetical protein ACP5G4_07445 [bacterium]